MILFLKSSDFMVAIATIAFRSMLVNAEDKKVTLNCHDDALLCITCIFSLQQKTSVAFRLETPTI